MKAANPLLLLLLLAACASGKEKKFTASTPADPAVRNFLGISLQDSIDFIRWDLALDETGFTLACNYGIGKPNTNGFINGGKKIEMKGTVKKEDDIYLLQNGRRYLNLIELNKNLLHILDEKKNLLIGNGGWSYALNSLNPVLTDQVNLISKSSVFKDSLVFQGRTPCGVPGIISGGMDCYKLKWLLTLYSENNGSSSYRIWGSPWHKEGGRKGTWEITKGKDGRIIYRLNDKNEKPFVYLLKLDEGVLIFTDAAGNLLVGDHDFSYTLNRVF